jgi:hypothetical protein
MEMKGWSIYSCSKSIGLNEQYIHYLLSLLEAPKEIFFLKYISKWYIQKYL